MSHNATRLTRITTQQYKYSLLVGAPELGDCPKDWRHSPPGTLLRRRHLLPHGPRRSKMAEQLVLRRCVEGAVAADARAGKAF